MLVVVLRRVAVLLVEVPQVVHPDLQDPDSVLVSGNSKVRLQAGKPMSENTDGSTCSNTSS